MPPTVTALSGRYITLSSDFLALTDERSLIESADDTKSPDTNANSFAELEAAAVGGGDAAIVKAAVVEVLNTAIAKAEAEVESFGRGRYVIPYVPADPIVKSMALELAWIDLRFRHGNLTQKDRDDARRALFDLGEMIAEGTTVLSSGTVDAIDGGAGEVYAYGAQERRFSRALFEGESLSVINR